MLSSRLDDLHELQWLGAADAAAANGVDFVTFVGAEVACPDGYRSQANAIYDLVGADRLDGLIVWTTALELFIGSRAMDEFCRRFDPLPIVSVERVLAGSPSVLMDDRQGMDEAVSHLIEAHGCERIAFIRGPANHRGAELRYQGYRDALASHGLRFDPALAPAVREWAPEPAAVAATKLLTNRSAPVDAFATANDDLALGVLGALDAQRLRVPYDVAVVGFDDHINLTHHGVGLEVMMLANLGASRAMSLTAALLPLTTVRAPFYQLGWRAVELLLERLSGVAVPDVVTIPTELVVRRSCGCFSSAVRDVVTRRVEREHVSDTGWEQVANEMRHALPRSNASLPTDWPERLAAAFLKDVETESAAAFLELLDELMRAGIAAGETLDNWSRALSVLRRHTASAHALADTSPAVEDFWLRVHSLVRELAARLTDYELFDTARRDRIVRGAGRRLNAAHDAEELAEVLVEELPELGIPSCHVALYGSVGERDEAARQADARAWSRSLLVYEAGRVQKLRTGRESFRSRELAPTARLGTATPSGLVAMPLYFHERQLGFALFELGPRLGWVYGELQEQLSSALHSALLIEREHRALAAVEQAHGELEQRVALRTAELATANDALARLVDEQAALRRVATLVAHGVGPAEIFSAVTAEVGRLFGSEQASVARFDADGPAIVVAGVSKSVEAVIPIRTRWELDEGMASAKVFRTGRSARVDAKEGAPAGGPVAEPVGRLAIVSTVASPIMVEGRLWGAITVSSNDERLPLDTEERLEKFTELVATAIANAESKSELAASRMRIVAASDETRRQIERDLHDGTQQRLASLQLAVRLAEVVVAEEMGEVRVVLSRIATGLADAITELQEISRGIHPAILTKGGLGPALRGLARRSSIPVEFDAAIAARVPEQIEVAGYYIVSEALANATKHSQASRIEVSLAASDGTLVLSVRDDGVGGADFRRGSGLVGLQDRVEALGGTLSVESARDSGTSLVVTLPLAVEPMPG
jgi:signal transduction histidine kinase/DNA-binding LacI/PurR family transcriptional regulator